MIQQKRLDEILKLVNENGSVTVQELMEKLEASEATIRRDLTLLNTNGSLHRVHGGATSLVKYYSTDESMEFRNKLNIEEKKIIGKYAASLIKPKDFVFIDGGTSTLTMIEYITEKDAVYITCSIVHARKLAEKDCKVYLTGGELKLSTEVMVGDITLMQLSNYNFTIGFWGVNGITMKNGFSTPDVIEAAVKKKSMQHCKDRYILADKEKFGAICPVTFANFEDATIITRKIEKKEFKKCKNIIEVV